MPQTPRVLSKLQHFGQLRLDLQELGAKMLRADGGNAFPLDLLAIAVLNRAVAVGAGFRTMIEQENFVCAAALLRLQIDSALRFSAAWLVDDPHNFAKRVLAGTHVRKLSDRAGKAMTDAYLVEQITPSAPWVREVYARTSGYIHLSDAHLANALRYEGDIGRISLKIGEQDEGIPEEIYLEAIDAFVEATGLLVRYISGWTLKKNGRPSAAR